MTEPDSGHLLPDPEWAAVVADAKRQAERIAAGHAPTEAPRGLGAVEGELVTGDDDEPLRFGTGLSVPLSGIVTAARHGGARKAPTFGVLHSAETPLRAGYAASIARMFATTTGDKSCHYMTDPAESWGVLDDLLVAWHVGNGNPNSIALEQAGYARFTRAEWLVPEGLAQMRRNGEIMRAARARFGIGLYWMTDAQLLQAHRREIVGGWATHDQCRRVLGGTTHTDPMPDFPLDVQMSLALEGATPTPTGDDEMPQFATINVPVGEPTVLSIPPVEQGAAGWGRAWATLVPDRMGAAGGPFSGRLMVLGGNGAWRNLIGKAPIAALELGKPVTVNLVTGDRCIVISETNAPLGVCLEYAPR